MNVGRPTWDPCRGPHEPTSGILFKPAKCFCEALYITYFVISNLNILNVIRNVEQFKVYINVFQVVQDMFQQALRSSLSKMNLFCLNISSSSMEVATGVNESYSNNV